MSITTKTSIGCDFHTSVFCRDLTYILLSAPHSAVGAAHVAMNAVASSDDWTNRDFVLAAVAQNGEALEYASDELRGDREVVLAAVAQRGYALEWALDDLQNDREVVLSLIHI